MSPTHDLAMWLLYWARPNSTINSSLFKSLSNVINLRHFAASAMILIALYIYCSMHLFCISLVSTKYHLFLSFLKLPT
jgi:hypothetical protein